MKLIYQITEIFADSLKTVKTIRRIAREEFLLSRNHQSKKITKKLSSHFQNHLIIIAEILNDNLGQQEARKNPWDLLVDL